MEKKIKKLTKLQRDRAGKIVKVFNCMLFEPEVCEICGMVEELVLKTKKK